MDVERTIEFILQTQARAEARAEKAEARADKTDRRVDGIAKLIGQGMRMLVKTQTHLDQLAKLQIETRRELKELAKAQKATEQSLKVFLSSRNGRNGKKHD